jgi:hypothetical protein
LSTYGSIFRGNREIPYLSLARGFQRPYWEV